MFFGHYFFVALTTAPSNKCNMLITHFPDSAKGSLGRSPPSPASRESRPAWREWPQLQEPQDPVRGQTDPVPGPAPGGRGPQRECRQHARPYESTQSQVEHLQNTVIALFAILFTFTSKNLHLSTLEISSGHCLVTFLICSNLVETELNILNLSLRLLKF